RRERVRVETHRRSREIAFLPRLGRIVGCASGNRRDTRRDDQRDTARACDRYVHERGSLLKTPRATRARAGVLRPRRAVATQRWAFLAATRREQVAWGINQR